MIAFLSHTWPWSLPPGVHFLMWFALLAPLVTGGGVLTAYFVSLWRDGPVVRARSTSTSASMASSTAVPAEGPTVGATAPFVVGRLPRPVDQPLLGWLRGGQKGLAAVLLARAAARGWLKHSDGSYTVVVDAPDLDSLDKAMMASLRPHRTIEASHVEAAAQEAAAGAEARMRRGAERAGLVRSGGEQAALAALGMSGAAVVVVAVYLRIVVRASLYEGAPLPTNLMFATLLLVGVAAFATARLARRHRQVRAYLAWLDDATVAVRQSVSVGAGHGDDLGLVAALGGLVALGASGRALAIPGVPPPPTTSSSSSSSCGSSSSSCSSSCGGSSCGGSSCGGGGGCS